MQPGYSKGSDEEAGAAGHGENEGAGDVSAIEEQKGVFTWRDVVYDIEIKGENQRGELTTPGLATVVLPSLDPNTKVFVDGSGLDLELPVVR